MVSSKDTENATNRITNTLVSKTLSDNTKPPFESQTIHYLHTSSVFDQLIKQKSPCVAKALKVRLFIDEKFYTLGTCIYKHSFKVLFIGILLLSLCCAGLKTARFESNAESLWIEVGGRLSQELAYTESHLGKGSGTLNEIIIQTSERNVLTIESLKLHLKVLQAVVSTSVEAYGTTWRFQDLCHAGNFPEFGDESIMDQELEKFQPCIIVSPLDCFWEGSKLLGPDYPVNIFNYGDVTWKNLDPLMIIEALGDYLPPTFVENFLTILDKAGISHAYQNKPCLDPFDSECPKSAPNYQSEEVSDIGQLMSNGCYGFSEKLMHWQPDLILGGIERTDNHSISSAKALQSIVQLMGEKDLFEFHRDSWKVMSFAWNTSVAQDILKIWERQFILAVNAASKNVSSDEDEVHVFTSNSFSEILDTFSRFSPARIILAIFIIMMYIMMTTFNATKLLNLQMIIGVCGLLLIILTSFAGLGITSVLSLSFNPATAQILPFVILGLAVDNLFVILRIFTMYNSDDKPVEEHTSKVLRCCGFALTISSLSVVICFLFAGYLPVPAIRTFSFQCGILMLLNMATSLVLLPAVASSCIKLQRRHQESQCRLTTEPTRRMNNDDTVALRIIRNDIFTNDTMYCERPNQNAKEINQKRVGVNQGRKESKNSNVDWYGNAAHMSSLVAEGVGVNAGVGEYYADVGGHNIKNLDREESKFMQIASPVPLKEKISCSQYLSVFCDKYTLENFCMQAYYPLLTNKYAQIFFLFLFICFFCGSFYGIFKIEDGLDLADIVPLNSSEYKFIKVQSNHFGFYHFYIVTQRNFDYASAYGQSLLHKLHTSILKVASVLKYESADVQPTFWLQMFADWLLELQEIFDMEVKQGRISTDGFHANSSNIGRLGYKLMVQSGIPNNPINKNRVTTGRMIDNGIIFSPAFYIYLTAWVSYEDLAYAVSQASICPPPPRWVHDEHSLDLKIPRSSPITFAQCIFYLSNLTQPQATMTALKSIRDITDNFTSMGLPTYPHGSVFTHWEQYFRIRMYTGIILALIFVFGFIFALLSSLHHVVSLLTVAVQFVSVVELFGVMGLLEIKLSGISATLVVIVSIISLRSSIYIASGYTHSLGSRGERVKVALLVYFPALFHVLSTSFATIFLLVTSEFNFIIRYFFASLSLVAVLILFNNLLVLPILLLLIGPDLKFAPMAIQTTLASPHLQHRATSSSATQRLIGPRQVLSRFPTNNNLSTINEDSRSDSINSIRSCQLLPNEMSTNDCSFYNGQTIDDYQLALHKPRYSSCRNILDERKFIDVRDFERERWDGRSCNSCIDVSQAARLHNQRCTPHRSDPQQDRDRTEKFQRPMSDVETQSLCYSKGDSKLISQSGVDDRSLPRQPSQKMSVSKTNLKAAERTTLKVNNDKMNEIWFKPS